MGRRKIEIKAIKDDRNRSVTFLKRKGGLFKKAHELSVLCSVDVAVIIFGHNKKLYEYSSGDINETIGRHQYYGGAHEHKGPADFAGKRDGDGTDDEEVDEAALEDMSQEHGLPVHIQNQPGFQHMRHAPSASPPVGNGTMPYPGRRHTPQPPGIGSRPSSRNAQHIPRPNSNLGHHQATHGPQIPNGYAYMQAPGPYGPPQQQQQHQLSMQHPGQQPAPHPQFQYPQQPPQHGMPAPYLQDQRRQGSMPPQYPQADRSQQPHQSPPQQHQPPQHQPQPPPQLQTQPPPPRQSPSPPQQESEPQQNHLQPHQPKPLSVKNSKGIYTPIDDTRSLLATGWDFRPTQQEPSPIKSEPRDLSQRNSSAPAGPSDQQSSATHQPTPTPFPPPQRTQSTTSLGGDKGRPRLKVQIPSEHSGSGSETDDKNAGGTGTGTGNTGGTSPKASAAGQSQDPNQTPVKTEGHGSGMVLPPPSPSASALLSAGATGPPNPFARPLPPGAGGPGAPPGGGNAAGGGANQSAYGANRDMDTPISALPSRFVADQFLPSPSSFYPDWGFGGGGRSAGDGNMLPSPLNFQTPVQGNAPGFGPGAESGSGAGPGDGQGKRKTPEGSTEESQGEAKRVKA